MAKKKKTTRELLIEKLAKLKPELTPDDKKAVAEKVKVSYMYVINALNGTITNDEKAKEILAEGKSVSEKRYKRVLEI